MILYMARINNGQRKEKWSNHLMWEPVIQYLNILVSKTTNIHINILSSFGNDSYQPQFPFSFLKTLICYYVIFTHGHFFKRPHSTSLCPEEKSPLHDILPYNSFSVDQPQKCPQTQVGNEWFCTPFYAIFFSKKTDSMRLESKGTHLSYNILALQKIICNALFFHIITTVGTQENQ